MKWILLALFSSQSYATLPLILPEAISFYKSSKSLFTSGQCSRAELEKNILRTETELSYRVEWDRREFEVTATDLLREAQLIKSAHTTELVVLRNQPQSNGAYLATIQPQTKLEVLATESSWALIRAQNQEGWIPLFSLESNSEDPGAAIAFVDTFLREKPDNRAKLITTVPQGTRLQEFEIKDNWIQLKTQKYTGFIDLGHVYLRSDFARWAHHKNLGWIQIQHRENFKLKTQDGLLFSIGDFTAFLSHPHRAFMINSQAQGPQKRSRVEIKKLNADRWAVSKLKEHGEVWWRKESVALNPQIKETSSEIISTENLLKRDIFSMAFTDTNKIQGIVSAKGIFKTEDGKNWHRIDSFGNSDYPVAVHRNGVWFVGTYRSLDSGKSFEPFIRWDKVADILAQKNINVGTIFKILKIESLKTPYIEILMDTGARRVSLQTHILNQTWRLVK